jgi:hypothetical protein
MIWYLRDRVGPDGYRTSHAAMIRAIGVACEGQWATLPPLEVYGWRYIIRHFRGAGQDKVADRLLTDYNWVKAKLHATGPQNLFPTATFPRVRTTEHDLSVGQSPSRCRLSRPTRASFRVSCTAGSPEAHIRQLLQSLLWPGRTRISVQRRVGPVSPRPVVSYSVLLNSAGC